MTKEKREAAAAQKILDEHFSEDSDKGREDRATASELLSGGIEKIQENYKAMLEEAKTLWGDLTGVKTYQDYMNSKEGGVEFLWMKDQEGFDVSKRISNNEAWYREFWEKKGRAPIQRELYDVAHENAISEYGDKTDEETVTGIREMEAAKKRVESIERIGETIQALKKEDLIVQTLLDPETYDEAYKPLLKQITEAGNTEVKQAARDSALILSKLAENFHKNYGITLKLAVIEVGKIAGLSPNTYGMAAFDVSRAGVAKVSQFMAKIEVRRKAGEAPNKIRYTGKYGVSYSEEQVTHATTEHRGHVLTAEQMDDIEEHLNILHNASLSNRADAKAGIYNGKSVLCRVDGDLGSYYVVLEVTNADGTVWFKTGMAGEKESINRIIAEHSASLLSHGDAGSTGQNNSAITIDRLPDALGIVKHEKLHQMAGERAFNAPLEQLQEAKQMEHEYEAEEIWKKTGWMRGPDGVWRFEIPDLLDQIDTDFMQVISETTLSHIYDNPKLYEAYPFLKDIPVRVENISDENEGTKGFVDGESIILSRKWLKEDPEAAKLTLIHELQHIIQGKAEPEFSKGGNTESAKRAMRDTLDDLKVKLRDARSNEAVNAYVEAREAADKAGDDIEEWFRLGKKAEEIGDKLGSEVKDGIDRLFYQIDELEKALKESSDYEAYRRLGGEAEAFMIMDRAKKKDNESMPNYNTPYGSAVVNFGNVEYTLPFMENDKVEEELPAIRDRYKNTDGWMKAPDGTPTKLTERQWLISHSGSFRKWFENWEIAEKYISLMHKNATFTREEISRFSELDRKTASIEAKNVFKKLFPAVKNESGYPEPATVKRKDGQEIVVPMTVLKEIRRHSADRRVLAAIPKLEEIIRDATFLYQEEKDTSRTKHLNQTTIGYCYYEIRIFGEPQQFIRLVVRRDENGKRYLYDLDFSEEGTNKRSPYQTMLLDSKNESQSDKDFFTHSIQD